MKDYQPATLTMHGVSDSIVPVDVADHFDEQLAESRRLLLRFQAYDHGLVGSFYAHATQLCYYAMGHFFKAVFYRP